jgi:hypothetical protein
MRIGQAIHTATGFRIAMAIDTTICVSTQIDRANHNFHLRRRGHSIRVGYGEFESHRLTHCDFWSRERRRHCKRVIDCDCEAGELPPSELEGVSIRITRATTIEDYRIAGIGRA